ncbi:S1 family peptidase [Ferruginibacter sp.]
MKYILKLLLFASFLHNYVCISQISTPFSYVIEKKKPAILPILSFDNSNKKYKHLGTGFTVSLDSTGLCLIIVTCEHVVTVKDSLTNKTIRPVEKIFANMNLIDGSIISVPLKVKFLDEKNDFALLEIKFDSSYKNYHLKINSIPLSHLDTSNNLREGETLLYIGYPMSLGVGKKSYPISRSGFISQNIEDSSKFLMDGFSQGGYSGSPVFRIKENATKGEWVFKNVGMLQAYPSESAIIKSKEKNDLKVIINPGFTIVGKLNAMVKTLSKMKCIYGN